MKFRFGTGIVRAAFAVAMSLMAATALAAGPGVVRKQIESSMLVTGKIEVNTEGKVSGYSLDKQDKLPAGIVGLLARAVPAWKFEPVTVDGKKVNALASMSIRLVAKKIDADNYTVAIRSASFGGDGVKPEEDISSVRLAPPDYPREAAYAGVAGAAYLLVKVGRDGKVTDVITEQVNLKVVASERQMEHWRNVLANASMRQARKWTFRPPTEGPAADDEFWIVRVPVVYSFDGPPKATSYGVWESYVPGPRQRNPWGDENEEGVAFSPDTLAPGGAYLAGSGLKLLTSVAGG